MGILVDATAAPDTDDDMTLPLREAHADEDGEGSYQRASPRISRDPPTRWQL